MALRRAVPTKPLLVLSRQDLDIARFAPGPIEVRELTEEAVGGHKRVDVLVVTMRPPTVMTGPLCSP